MMNGKLEIWSRHGEGTTITIYVPFELTNN